MGRDSAWHDKVRSQRAGRRNKWKMMNGREYLKTSKNRQKQVKTDKKMQMKSKKRLKMRKKATENDWRRLEMIWKSR